MGSVPCDVPIPVAHKNRAELQAALQTDYSGLDGVRIAVGDEQIIAAGVRGHDNASRGKRLWNQVTRRGVRLRFAANASIRVILAGVKVGPVGQDARQSRHVAAARAIVGFDPIPRKQLGCPHKARDRVPVWIVRADIAFDNSSQRVVGQIAGDRAVIVVLGDDDVGRLAPSPAGGSCPRPCPRSHHSSWSHQLSCMCRARTHDSLHPAPLTRRSSGQASYSGGCN